MSNQAKFSPATGGIYPLSAYETFPQDAVDIPDELYAAYKRGEVFRFVMDNGLLVGIGAMPDTTDPRENMKVTTFQAHAAIARQGLYEQVSALMAAPETPFEVKLAWDKAQHFSRLSPTVVTMGAALGLNDQQLDDLFTLAATIEA